LTAVHTDADVDALNGTLSELAGMGALRRRP